MLPNPEGIIARASNVSLDVTRLPRLSMLLAVPLAASVARAGPLLPGRRASSYDRSFDRGFPRRVASW